MNKKELEEKFWKLKPIERLEYHTYKEDLEKRYDHFFPVTKVFILISIIYMIILYAVIYFYGNGLINFKVLGEIIFSRSLIFIFIGFIIDIVIGIFSIFGYRKELNKLNKRFKI